ncbi:N-lysine methyltransferase KMT5A-like [Ruditapes philippinarum]|uniref:N-lysine methyltransferase KMT5A-like n=1 Tax=Ruditapes philippinarum TaxID=129788 RepID=UPI00295B19F8|nr:N-lysine methyltransferase KMT5A-like [Ruditapes philippinarum]
MDKKSRTKRKSPLCEAQHWLKENKDPPGFAISTYPTKGRGIITTIYRRKGDFLLHYAGEVISGKEGERREKLGSSGFRFFYRNGRKDLCVDATDETGRFGRLVNHGDKKERNAIMKGIDGHWLLFAISDIDIGDEILYDYGIEELPWKKILENVMICLTYI